MNVHIPTNLGAAQPYDPAFDPLVNRTPGRNQNYAPTYWIATAGNPPPDDGPVLADGDVDVDVVGSGFTGLTTALYWRASTVLTRRCSKPVMLPGVAALGTAVRDRMHQAVSVDRSGLPAGAKTWPSGCMPRS